MSETLEKLIKPQIVPTIEVERAKTNWPTHAGEKVTRIGEKQGRTQATIYRRLEAVQ